MLTPRQQTIWSNYYTSTTSNEHLDAKTSDLIGLAAAMALDCPPCTEFYLARCKQSGADSAEIGEVLAKVMAVAGGQKKIQFASVLDKMEREGG